MNKFFKRMRFGSLENHRKSKYLKYALGEIVLVVIGILIALQINNWNEQRKANVQERQLLNNLQIEFNDNLRDLDSITIEVDKVIVSLETVFELFAENPSIKTSDSLDVWLSGALYSPNWRPSEYLLNNLSNSGSIADLKNDNLKLLLYKWSRLRSEMIEVQGTAERTGQEIIAYIKSNGSLRNVDVQNSSFHYRKSTLYKDNSSLLLDYQFENHIDDKLFMYEVTRTVLKEARVVLQQLIEETNN